MPNSNNNDDDDDMRKKKEVERIGEYFFDSEPGQLMKEQYQLYGPTGKHGVVWR